VQPVTQLDWAQASKEIRSPPRWLGKSALGQWGGQHFRREKIQQWSQRGGGREGTFFPKPKREVTALRHRKRKNEDVCLDNYLGKADNWSAKKVSKPALKDKGGKERTTLGHPISDARSSKSEIEEDERCSPLSQRHHLGEKPMKTNKGCRVASPMEKTSKNSARKGLERVSSRHLSSIS